MVVNNSLYKFCSFQHYGFSEQICLCLNLALMPHMKMTIVASWLMMHINPNHSVLNSRLKDKYYCTLLYIADTPPY